ncbi:DUF6053 domain-containing protein [Lysobacter enzymogenes]|uniref:DUF6053 domain-containing protein n=1 Tax=Lysobacter enzymogenes TaxID=69 RepID=UPI003D18CF8C
MRASPTVRRSFNRRCGGPSGPRLFAQVAAIRARSLGPEGPPTTAQVRPPRSAHSGSANTTRLRPPRLAAYKAASARANVAALSSPAR